MLDLVLKKLREGGTYSLAGLAQDFEVSQAQMEQMIHHLARMGYLKAAAGCSAGHCPGCSISASCGKNTPALFWLAESHKQAPQ